MERDANITLIFGEIGIQIAIHYDNNDKLVTASGDESFTLNGAKSQIRGKGLYASVILPSYADVVVKCAGYVATITKGE